MTSEWTVIDGEAVETWDSKALVSLSGATYRQIKYWVGQGWINAVGRNNPGSGIRVLFIATEVDVCRYAVALLAAGFHPQAALAYGRQLATGGEPVLVLSHSQVQVTLAPVEKATA